MIRSVVFDVGETLLDDTSEWGRWADWIGVPRHTFSAVMGAVVVGGRDNGETFQYFRPGFDIPAERQRREDAGCGEQISESDLYPDVRPALAALRAAGYWVGVSGNQSARCGDLLRELDLPADGVMVSGDLGLIKPSPAYFDWMAGWAPGERDEILYVGDHRDFDVIPARAQGFHAALVRRGPWGHLWADDAEVRRTADWVVGSLRELPALLGPRQPGLASPPERAPHV
ncbi:HAD family hydrolase [Kineosporia rhizophila]|uniref:HAD family hydrolase n=1 Tax=Kineosporia TaxID=49184 RepID=UPI001E41C6E7|nr:MULTISPECIES: HAD family hydrolase [Kineosporia]MCE0539080.1 HAD family hydrolase [Kineosporia rhizophila]GLY17817.1 haloacid dehalogenase [Kineosporia sp. NBRC 101677]